MLVLPDFETRGEKVSFIRRMYLNDTEATEVLKGTLAGTPYWLDSGSNKAPGLDGVQREPRLYWQTSAEKRRDLEIFNLIQTITNSTLNLSAYEYTRICRGLMPNFIQQSTLFRQLSQVRSAKHNEPVTDHILSVIENLSTDGLPIEQIRILRITAWKHDLGKIVDYLPFEEEHLLKGDFVQLHALLSVHFDRVHALNKEKFGSYTLADRDADEKMRAIIRFHHIYELVSQGVLTKADFDALVPNEIREMLAIFSVADAAAVDEYNGRFDLENLETAVVNGLVFASESTSNLESGERADDAAIILSFVIIKLIVSRIENAVYKIDRLLLSSAEKAKVYVNQLILFLNSMLGIPALNSLHIEFRKLIGKYSTSIMLASAV